VSGCLLSFGFDGILLDSHCACLELSPTAAAPYHSRRRSPPPAPACFHLQAAGWQFQVSRMAPAAVEPPADAPQSAEPQQLKQPQQSQALRSFTLRIR
jgi:hypothetical protein